MELQFFFFSIIGIFTSRTERGRPRSDSVPLFGGERGIIKNLCDIICYWFLGYSDNGSFAFQVGAFDFRPFD